jgi:outer membrane receptor protein involved in Fe transport
MNICYRNFKYLILCILIIIFIPLKLFGGTTGKIAGKIIDAKTKEPLIGANILIVGTSMGAASDVDGNYFIINIPPGVYEVKASEIGYAPIIIKDVRVSADQTTRLNFEMSEKAVQIKSVVVTASKPLIQKDLTSTQSSISGNSISMLPVEDVQSVINLQAGVVNGHFRGGRLGEVKYLIDGVSVNDVYSGEASMQASTNSIQELQVITGTFNAEYGQAMSGVVNQITKIPKDRYTGSFSAYTGDYVTSRTNLFQYMGRFNPLRSHNIQGSLGGPIPGTSEFVKFFSSARYLSNDGYLYGKRMFTPQDSSNFSSDNPANWYIDATGDGKDVPMNYSRQLSLQQKLVFKVGKGKGIVLEGLYQKHNYENYDHMFILNPDGNYTNHDYSFLGSISYTHVFSQSAFLDLLASTFETNSKRYVYADPLDPRYVSQDRFSQVSGNALYTGGTQNWHFSHNSKTYTFKADLTDQITDVHELKGGVEADLHTLAYKDFQVLVDAATNYKPALPRLGDFDYNVYTNHPYQLAAYLQDKIELSYLIVNIGIRYDYFQPDGEVLNNPNNISVLDSLTPPFPSGYFHKASPKWQLSPRLGISYPISAKGAVHISYGHFFEVPPYQYLYKNPNFRIPLTGNYPDFVGSTIGNADLKPQETVMYELGLQQELTSEIAVDVTAYYKDIRNLLGVALHVKNNFKKFAEYINTDYGAVTGFTISFEKRFNGGLGATLDYTYQVAKGDASDPNAAYNLAQATPPIEPNKQLVPLNWDRRHSLNFTITAGSPNDFIVSAVGQLGSGLPYTPSYQNQRTGLENSANKPTFFNVDLYITKYFKLLGTNLSVFAKIYNLFDTPNELDVFTDTGRAGYTLEETRAQAAPHGVNTIKQYFTRPDFYSAPRQILVGASIDF